MRAVWLKFGIERRKYPTKPSILRSSETEDGFFLDFDDIAVMFFGSVLKPTADMILPKYDISLLNK